MLARHPDQSLPRAFADEAELEALYRFLRNERVSFDALLTPHRDEVRERARDAGLVLAIHDTTSFAAKESSPNEVGYLNTGKAGFFGHFSLLVDSACREPLGVARVELFKRAKPPRARRAVGRRNASGTETRKNPDRESLRWSRGVAGVGAELDRERVIHVMDREADIYDLLAMMVGEGHRFVVRLARDRRVIGDDDAETVHASMSTAPLVMERAVHLSRRAPSSAPRARKTHPARDERVAKLNVHASQLTIVPPRYLAASHAPLSINVVHVVEVDVADDLHPVEWFLLTNESVDSPDAVGRVVDHYRGRWVIEEMFKAIKSGCAYDERHLESERSLHNLLAITIPIAHRMLRLRSLARETPSAPASTILSRGMIALLCAKSRRVPKNPTVREALLGIAGLGGHIRSNGEPGWLVIYRGLERLVEHEIDDIHEEKM